ncbi:outer membrane protein [Bradyrhizobium prioriisuperbiae]|uniref:outer membrane protein n=1 Tax=Bradyrhizobium prioriisuperbiae TaxID=2854389 RepID=UPI0028EA448B|nr:outer membrane beta-barrel protein [Bradyrhizobium prioritasuperba]
MKIAAFLTGVAGAALIAGVGSAHAADMPAKVYRKAPPMVVQAYNWTGFYAGVNAGFGFGRDLTTARNGVLNEQSRIGALGGLGGGQIGYNWQFGDFGLGNVVLGVETDIQGAGIESDRTCGVNNFCGPTSGTTYSQKLDWFGTARGRIGVATGPVLSYVTGGFAYGSVETGFSRPLVGSSSFKETRTGWTIGSGIEAALGGNWTGKIEYLYLDLGTQNGAPLLATLPTSSFSSEIREHIFRVGLNYRIGGTGVYAPEPVRNWAGWYVGGNGGSATARNPTSVIPASDPTVRERTVLSPDGYFGGAQIGYNWQAANWVFGLETDFQGSSQKDDKVCLFGCPTNGLGGAVDQKMQWFGTARGRLGYSVGSSLFYATGGFAYGNVKTNFTFLDVPSVSTSISQTRTGWTVGAGLESPFEFFGLFGKNWTSKTEYLYVDLGRTTGTVATPGFFGGSQTFTSRAQEHIFRTGLNYYFNSPVVAKY